MSSRVEPTMKLCRIVVAAAVACGAVACTDNGSTTSTAPLVASAMVANTGVQGQSATVGQALPQGISVHVTDANGTVVPGALVSWVVLSGGGSIDSASASTNANGDATTHWTLGSTAGAEMLQASLGGALADTITATGLAGPEAALALVSGSPQTIAAGAATQPFEVRAMDQYGNAVANATITWTVAGAGTLSSTTTPTDANGIAEVTLTADSAPGTYTVTASDAVRTITFVVTAN